MVRKLGLALAATLIALVLAEVAVRIYERVAPPPTPAPIAPLDPELLALPDLSGVMELGAPHVRGRFMNVVWQTNAAGMRAPEFTRRAQPGTFRIAVLGDSFVAGVGVPLPEIYVEQLAGLLARSGSDTAFEVLNFGFPGLNMRGALDRGERLASLYGPRLFVYGYTLNDVFEPGEEDTSGAKGEWLKLQNDIARYERLPSHLMRMLVPRWLALRDVFEPTAYTKFLVRSYAEPDKAARLRAGFGELAAFAARSGACAHVMVHTDLAALRFGHRFGDAYDTVVDAAREAGLTAHSTFPDFRWRDSARLRLSALDGHPNAAGHRILAESLYDALRELPPSCGLPQLAARGE